MYVYMGSFLSGHGAGQVGTIYYILAIVTVIMVVMFRQKFILAGNIMVEACKGISENPTMFFVLLGAYGIYILYVVMTMAAFVSAAGVLELSKDCVPEPAGYLSSALNYIVFHYVWTTMLYNKVRLATVAGTIGTWVRRTTHFCCGLCTAVTAVFLLSPCQPSPAFHRPLCPSPCTARSTSTRTSVSSPPSARSRRTRPSSS
jgi:hypothetical protein